MMKRNPKYMAYYYINTLTRCPPYLVGILLGWMLNRAKSRNLTIKKVGFQSNLTDIIFTK